MNNLTQSSRLQRGSMLIEALISILIFSIGILAIIGLQATSIRMSSDAKFRSDASMLANQHLALMWADVASAVTSTNQFDPNEFSTFYGNTGLGLSGGGNFDNWFTQVAALLPNASAVVAPPAGAGTELRCDSVLAAACPTGVLQTTRTDIEITIQWQLPGESPHTYRTRALVSAQKRLL